MNPQQNDPLFPDVVQALRQAMADLGACAVAFEKMEIGTEWTPIHVRKDDARRAYARVQAALQAHDTRVSTRRHMAEHADVMEALGDA